MRVTTRSRTTPRGVRSAVLAVALVACAGDAEPGTGATAGATSEAGECRIEQRNAQITAPLPETSGIAASRGRPGTFWTHNDSGGDPVVFGIAADGRPVGQIRVRGAENEDWEDIAVGPCPSGSCLYIADTGDNAGRRDDVAILRFPENARVSGEARPERFPVRYPDGPRDAEAIFVLPDGGVFLVSKGRHDSQELFRYPLPLRPDERVTLEPLALLGQGKQETLLQITGASASPSGEWVAVRRYKSLAIYRTARLLAGDSTPHLQMDLTPVGEAQGEGVALLDDGTVVLTSEGGFRNAPGTISVLRCELE